MFKNLKYKNSTKNSKIKTTKMKKVRGRKFN